MNLFISQYLLSKLIEALLVVLLRSFSFVRPEVARIGFLDGLESSATLTLALNRTPDCCSLISAHFMCILSGNKVQRLLINLLELLHIIVIHLQLLVIRKAIIRLT